MLSLQFVGLLGGGWRVVQLSERQRLAPNPREGYPIPCEVTLRNKTWGSGRMKKLRRYERFEVLLPSMWLNIACRWEAENDCLLLLLLCGLCFFSFPLVKLLRISTHKIFSFFLVLFSPPFLLRNERGRAVWWS